MQLTENSLLNNGKYRIVRCLGQGGYGITYLATTTEEVRGGMGHFPVTVPVAIKEFFVKTYCVRDSLTSDVLVPTEEGKTQVPRLKNDFLKEATSMSKMSHPNIVKVIEVFEDHQTVYYVMQYLEGCSLADKVDRDGPLSSKEAHDYIFQAAGAVDYLHDNKLCHYDVKPSNIIITNLGRAVLIDFGISRHYDEKGEATYSHPVGFSSGFSSPEQRQGAIHEFSPASDIYSLAATLYYMLTGKTPPAANEIKDGALEKCPSSVPPAFWNAVKAGMEPDSGLRPQTINKWLVSLDTNTVTRSTVTSDQNHNKKPQKSTQTDNDNPSSKKGVAEKNDKDLFGRAEKKIEASGKEGRIEKPGNAKEKETPNNTNDPYPPFEKKEKRTWIPLLLSFFACVIIGGFAYLFFFAKSQASPPIVKTPQKIKTSVTDMEWPHKNRHGNTYVYTGEVIDSVPNGKGVAKLSDGGIYEGSFRDGMREGLNVTYTDNNGNIFTGDFSNDSIVQGRITAKEGTYFKGTFAEDMPYNGDWYNRGDSLIYHVNEGKLTEVK